MNDKLSSTVLSTELELDMCVYIYWMGAYASLGLLMLEVVKSCYYMIFEVCRLIAIIVILYRDVEVGLFAIPNTPKAGGHTG